MTKPENSIVIAGYYGFQNLGDEMVLEALLHGFKQALPDYEAVVVSRATRTTRTAVMTSRRFPGPICRLSPKRSGLANW
jgi:polysaccharide pyruvyl transferase WcaK-like protein